MGTLYSILECNSDDAKYIGKKLFEFNTEFVPYVKGKKVINLSFCVKNDDDNIIAGITGYIYWANGCLHVDHFWIEENYRKKGIGKELLKHIEEVAKNYGVYLSELETYEWQAKDFYEKNGYEVFGVLDGCPKGWKKFYLKKTL